MTHEYMLPAEAADILCVTPKTVTRWVNTGRLPAIKTIGGHVRLRRADVFAAAGRAA